MVFISAFYSLLLLVFFVLVFRWAKRHNDLKEEQNHLLREILEKLPKQH
ncbi:hypothetical protein SAMN05192553_10111 [Cyclobacterium xiamenense]|uniref:Uncharacterized protein n=1 Tax=Cyclobacterium xiamenense TaxID=1297121 RepID=A0A1H6SYX5_9BACT|nr:hypothetical protein [Cyclobacterium xiamenense]SEI73078.1 hypothetical protein SAMN05192553_10111 [Cyclobacterium xiamenense]